MILSGLRQLAAILQARSANLDIVHTTYANPKPVRDVLRAGRTAAFEAWIRQAPAAQWAAYPGKSQQHFERVKRFVQIAPDAAAFIAGWIKEGGIDLGGSAEGNQTTGAGTVDFKALPRLGVLYGNVNSWMQTVSEGETPKLVAALKAAGCTGYHIELLGGGSQFPGSAIAKHDWSENPEQLMPLLKTLATSLREAGLWLFISQANWNAPYKKKPVSWHTALTDLVHQTIGEAGIIYEAVSEPKSSKQGGTLIDQAVEVMQHAQRYGWKIAENMIVSSRADLIDVHVSKASVVADATAGRLTMTSTDHSITLAGLMEGGTREGQRFVPEKLAAHAAAALRAGQWYAAYGFWHTAPDYTAIAVLGQQLAAIAGHVTDPQPAGGAQLLKFEKASREHYVNFTCSGIEAWPEQQKNPDKPPTTGWIVVKGVHVEQFRKGMTSQHLKNAYGKIGGGEHGVAIAQGETVPVCLESYDGVQTNVLPFVWPWKSTR